MRNLRSQSRGRCAMADKPRVAPDDVAALQRLTVALAQQIEGEAREELLRQAEALDFALLGHELYPSNDPVAYPSTVIPALGAAVDALSKLTDAQLCDYHTELDSARRLARAVTLDNDHAFNLIVILDRLANTTP